MSWIDFANHFLSNQRLHAWSWINRTFSWEWCFFFVGTLALSVLGLFVFYFGLVWGEQVTDALDFSWQSKGEDHFRSWFPFFLCLHGDNSVFVQMSSGPKAFLHISSIFFRSLIGNFLSFFAFSHFLIGNFLPFLLSPFLDWEFSFFVFFRRQGLTFSPKVKVYGKLGFWLRACRMAGHDICQGLASGSGIKGMPHTISMTQMQQWWFGNFMQN